jgi:type II secretory pathway component PulF
MDYVARAMEIGSVAYVTDTSYIPEPSLDRLMGLSMLVLDCVRLAKHGTHQNLDQALETVAKTAGNKVIEIAVMTSRESVKEGERIATPLRKSGVFPPMVIQMVAIGEETGNLDAMLSKIADFYDQEVDIAVKALTSMIEPIIIVVMGLVIGFIVIAMFLPMFELGSLAGRA